MITVSSARRAGASGGLHLSPRVNEKSSRVPSAVSLATSANSSSITIVVFVHTRQGSPAKPFLAKPFPVKPFPAKPLPVKLLPVEPFPVKPFPVRPWQLAIYAMARDNCRKALDCWRRIVPPAALISLFNEPPLSRGALLVRSAEGLEPAGPQRNSIRAREPVVLQLLVPHGVSQPRPGRDRAGRVSYAPDDMSATNSIVLFRRDPEFFCRSI
jgi:hypothetical protein